MERALAKLHLYRHGTDLRAWLFTVMHNVYVNQLRAARPLAPLDAHTLETCARRARNRRPRPAGP
ncbi:MAG: hypothetical protein RML56_04110 [Burkholderiales bacterium]|nr:hypothetical protein [Burkholderiales bacterium]